MGRRKESDSHIRKLHSGGGPGLARGFRSSTCPWFQATGRWPSEARSLDKATACTYTVSIPKREIDRLGWRAVLSFICPDERKGRRRW